MVRCIMQSSHSADKENLLSSLEKIVKNCWSDAVVVLKTDNDYWKWQGYREFIYNVSCPKFIFVSEVMTLFDIKWEYLKNEVFNVDTNKEYDSEEAIWSKINHPEEVFLKPEVEWVHIYTWLD
jgi:hypothetical protein